MTRPNANFISPATIVEHIFQYTEKYEVIRRKYLWFFATSPIHSPVFYMCVSFFFCSDQFQVSVGVKFCFHRYNLVLLKQWTHLSNSWALSPVFLILFLLFLFCYFFLCFYLFIYYIYFIISSNFFSISRYKIYQPKYFNLLFYSLLYNLNNILDPNTQEKKKMALLRISSWV